MGIEISSTTAVYDQRMAGDAKFPAFSVLGEKDTLGTQKSAEKVREQKKQEEEVARLKKRDQEVQAHEQAHVAAGGRYVKGGPSYTYTTGPDGQRYATGGEVSIDTSPGKTPEETIRKAQAIRSAALAPAQPSGQDLSVAAAAASMEAAARAQLSQQAVGQAEATSSALKAYGDKSLVQGETSEQTISIRI